MTNPTTNSSENWEKRAEELVNVEEIWVPCEKGAGQGIRQDGKNYELLAIIANGYPLFLKDGVMLENIKMTPEQVENAKKRINPTP